MNPGHETEFSWVRRRLVQPAAIDLLHDAA